jgi:type IV pilus assembly protein PilX
MQHFGTRMNKQKGAALVVGLVLMMVLTILAISTMRTATLELLMAGNAQYKERAFQLAETGLRDAARQIDNGTLNPVPSDDWIGSVTGSIDDSGDEYVVDLRYVREGNPPAGTSNSPKFTAFYYEMTSTGRTIARNAKSVQTQGFWILAPLAL